MMNNKLGRPGLPELKSHIGASVEFKNTNLGDAHGVVIDEVCVEDHPGKIVKAQLIEFERGRREVRVAYWIEGKKESVRGKWVFGQFSSTMTLKTWSRLLYEVSKRDWLV